MATRAETAKAQAARDANPPKPKKKKRARRDSPVDTSKPGVSATDRKAGASRKRAAKKGGAKLEESETGRPSRKSTRKSADRTKRTTNLQLRAIRKTRSPKERARKAAAKKK